jgi:hypothetical protein
MNPGRSERRVWTPYLPGETTTRYAGWGMNHIVRDAMNGHFLWAMILCSLAIAIGVCSAQQEPGTTITGKIIDADNGTPLEDAIVFLANTPRGTSSENDGTFRIASVPAGTYELVISRVGYERQSVHFQAAKTESLYYMIKLRPQPVRTKEVEVLGKRPAEARPNQQLFFPKESPDTYCFYGIASSLPIGIFFADSAFYMYSLDTAIVDSEKYIRLWLLYENLSQTPYDLDPMKCVQLHMKGDKYSFKNLLPARFSRLLADRENKNAVRTISESIGKPLQKMATQQSKILSHFLPEFGLDVPLRGGASPKSLNRIYMRSTSQGILTRTNVYPDNSVNGNIYFPFPGLDWKATGTDFPEASQYHYQIEIITQCGSKVIDFIPQ